MPVYLEAGLFRQSPFQAGEVAIREIDHFTAAGADEVMVVLGRPTHKVAAAVSPGVHLADKA